MKSKQNLIFISLLLSHLTIHAYQSETTISAEKPIIYCPEANQLIKKGLNWKSTTNIVWKSSEASFGDEISHFSGAQWQGVKVGPMICIYESKTKGVFPIEVQNNHLFEQPTQKNWSVGEDNYLNCVSNNIKDCPLTPKIKAATPTSTRQIFQEIGAQ
ncbi:MAG: hypothetical protein HON78_00195 [Legionellales bacterium]|jgi:hypothetical protein|nr:hypothetical protein [Legionellales bacterium]